MQTVLGSSAPIISDKIPVETGYTVQQSLTPRPVNRSLCREKSLLDKGYLFGSTTVFKDGGQYFFAGDIQHCGLKAIAHNAARMRDEMARHGWGSGHMNYNDPPTFEKVFSRTQFEQNNESYKEDIYAWDDNGIPIMFDIFGVEPQTESYYDPEQDKKFYEDLRASIAREEAYAKSIGEDLDENKI